MHGKILFNLFLFLNINYQVNAEDKGSIRKGTCIKINLQYECRYVDFQVIQDFKWLTKEDAVLCKRPSYGIILNLVNTIFPFKALNEGWLQSPCYINVLKISRSNLESIEKDAFNTIMFSNLTELKLRYTDIWLINFNAFKGLTELKRLTLDSLNLDVISEDVLVACPKLKEIRIYFSFDTTHPIQNKWFSSDQLLNELETVDLFGNEIRAGIDNTTFIAARNIKILSMRDNYIETIGENAFKPIKNLKSLDLTYNLLKIMPSELKELMSRFPNAYFELGYNPWECNCDLESVREFYLTHEPSPFPIICGRGMRIEECMDLCLEDSNCHDFKAASESLLPFWHELSLTESENSVNCRAPKVSIALKKPTTHFLIGQHLDGDYFINLNGFTSEKIVVVFKVGVYALIEDSSCITNNRNFQTVYTQFSIRLRPDTSYLFCFLDKRTSTIQPLNCFAFHSKPDELNTSNNVWIFNEDRTIIILLCIASGIISIFLGIAIVFIVQKLRALITMNVDDIDDDRHDDDAQINQSCYIENRPPLRRKRRVTKLRSKPKNYHPKLHRINSRSMSVVLSPGVSTSTTKSVNRCCDSENCQCYCEILMI